MDKRGIKGGDQWRTQRWCEGITRTLDATDVNYPSVGALSNLDMDVFTYPGGVDVTAAVTSGAMAAPAQVITLLRLGGAGKELTRGTDYEVVVYFRKDGHDFANHFFVACPDDA
jgi:hypothetical protein